jgi:REP element-mobilizing transposase RayT
MPGFRRYFEKNGGYHTMSATRGRRPWLSDSRIVTVVIEAINASRAKGRLFLLAYALMPDHLHLLCVPGEGQTISSVMKAIKGMSGKAANKAGLVDGPVWQQSFYDR